MEEVKTVWQEEAEQATRQRIMVWTWCAIGLAFVNLLLWLMVNGHQAEARDTLVTMEKMVTAENTASTIQAAENEIGKLEKNLATLVAGITPAEKLEKVFSEEISSSIQLIVNQIARIKEELQKPAKNK